MHNIKKIYLYLVSVIALVIWMWGGITLVNMALKTWVFTKADNYYTTPCLATKNPDGSTIECDAKTRAEQEKADAENRIAQKQRDATQALSMILIATPVWYFHWRLARKEQ